MNLRDLWLLIERPHRIPALDGLRTLGFKRGMCSPCQQRSRREDITGGSSNNGRGNQKGEIGSPLWTVCEPLGFSWINDGHTGNKVVTWVCEVADHENYNYIEAQPTHSGQQTRQGAEMQPLKPCNGLRAIPVLCFSIAFFVFVLWVVWYEIPVKIFGIPMTRVLWGILLGAIVYFIFWLVRRISN